MNFKRHIAAASPRSDYFDHFITATLETALIASGVHQLKDSPELIQEIKQEVIEATSYFKYEIAILGGSIVSVFASTPANGVADKMQTGTFKGFRHQWNEGLFTGASANLVSKITGRFLLFALKGRLENSVIFTSLIPNPSHRTYTALAVAALLECLTGMPLEQVFLRKRTGTGGYGDVAKDFLSLNGLQRIYKGLVPIYMRNVLNPGIAVKGAEVLGYPLPPVGALSPNLAFATGFSGFVSGVSTSELDRYVNNARFQDATAGSKNSASIRTTPKERVNSAIARGVWIGTAYFSLFLAQYFMILALNKLLFGQDSRN
ncbi:hypothetical protein EBR96_02575 [bacterium]|nr:hypothetical protein [bacterium]